MTPLSSRAATTASPRPRVSMPPARGESPRPADDSPPPALPSTTSLVIALAGVVALGLTLAVGAVAVAVHFALAGLARDALGFRFPGVPATVGTAATIFASNLRVLAGMFGVLAVAQLLARAPDRDPRLLPWLLWLLELLVAGQVAVNALVVGSALGAYGGRMARAMLPHGPVELAAWAVALALVIAGRRRPLPIRGIVAWALASVGLLAIAACLETWVTV